MHRHDRDRIGFRIGPAFDLGLGVVPVASHGLREGRETTAVISARHLQEQFGIGEGAFGRQAVTRSEDGANIELFNGFREELVGRCGARFAGKVLQHLEGVAENGVGDRTAVGPQMKPRRGPVFPGR